MIGSIWKLLTSSWPITRITADRELAEWRADPANRSGTARAGRSR